MIFRPTWFASSVSPVAIKFAKVKTEGVVIIVNIVVAERTELGEDLTC